VALREIAAATDSSAQHRERDRHQIERTIVNLIVSGDRTKKWTRAEIEIELQPRDAVEVKEALRRLSRMRVIDLNRTEVRPTQCTSHLERLQVIGI
jgi:hypothetical protein